MRLSLFSEIDVLEAARRVVSSSRRRHEHLIGLSSDAPQPDGENPYVRVFLELYRFARGEVELRERASVQLDVARTVLGDPLYTGAESEVESPLLLVVASGAVARLKLLEGHSLTPEETELLS